MEKTLVRKRGGRKDDMVVMRKTYGGSTVMHGVMLWFEHFNGQGI